MPISSVESRGLIVAMPRMQVADSVQEVGVYSTHVAPGPDQGRVRHEVARNPDGETHVAALAGC